MRLRPILIAACGLAAACGPGERSDTQHARTALPPNILLLIGDDHGYPYFGFMGDPIVETPNLDRLAAEGTVFTHGFATSNVCRPSLWTFLTGRAPLQIQSLALGRVGETLRPGLAGVRQWGRLDSVYADLIREDPHTLPRVLARAGYASFEGGKFWEGSYETAGFSEGASDLPSEHGFDSALNARQGGDGLAIGRGTLQPVIDFIDRHRERPFFVWYSPMLPHAPFDAPERLRALYRGRGLSQSTIGYYANCTRFDEGVGELLLHLERRGLRSQTLVVYASDNGWHQPRDAEYAHKTGGPRGKLSLDEQAFRTPIVFQQAGVVPAGSRRDELVSTADLYPTLLDYAGAPPVAGRPGIDLRPAIEGRGSPVRNEIVTTTTFVRREEEDLTRANVRWRREAASTLTSEKWHYVHNETRGEEHLYTRGEGDGEAGQRPDRIAAHPELAREFRRRIEAWKAEQLRALEPGDG